MVKLKNLLLPALFALFLILLSGIPAEAALKSGYRGTEVKRLQMNLNGLGYSKITEDGIFGDGTCYAVKCFQSATGLTVDGVAGDKTLAKIRSIVTTLQDDLRLLGYDVGFSDGVYGSATRAAVKRFQAANGLSSDGIAGYRTLNKISAVKGMQDSDSIISSGYHATPSQVITYSLSDDANKNITKNFKVGEFACRDGSNTIKIDLKLAALLEDIRAHFNKPVVITSAYRTPSYNAKVGGSSGSLHLFGQAADISINGVSPRSVARYAESLGVKGIGLYSTFVHVDTRTTKYYWSNGGAVSTFR